MPSTIPSIAISPSPPCHLSPSPSLTTGPSVSSSEDELDRMTFLAAPNSFPQHESHCLSRRQHQFGTGLDRDHFDALIQASRNKNVNMISKREVSLRREVTLKAHKGKQEERRARFLAKIGAPPSPTAINLPATPPESPAVFHFTLPSPGLVSPLAVFEAMSTDVDCHTATPAVWVEQVDFHVAQQGDDVSCRMDCWNRRRLSLPSLEDISLRFQSTSSTQLLHYRPPVPLPAFLRAGKSTAPAPDVTNHPPLPPQFRDSMGRASPTAIHLHRQPLATHALKLAVPRVRSTSPIALTEANLLAFERRSKAAKGLNTLRRRLSTEVQRAMTLQEDKRYRRSSAPPLLCH